MDLPNWTEFAEQLKELLGSYVVAEVLDEKRATMDDGLGYYQWCRMSGRRGNIPIDFRCEFTAATTHSLAKLGVLRAGLCINSRLKEWYQYEVK